MPPEPAAGLEPRWLDAAEQRAWWALLEVGTGLFDLLTHRLKDAGGLTLEDYEVLHILSQADGYRLRIGELSDALLASRTRLSQRVDRLGQRGWVERTPCPDDGRAVLVMLTEAGYDFLVGLAPTHLEHVRTHVFDHLSAADVQDLGRSLSKIAEHLHEQRTRQR